MNQGTEWQPGPRRRRPAGGAGAGADGPPWPTATTRPVALLGWPARHSLSPVIHNAAFREQRLDLVYLALPTHPDDLVAVVRALGAVGAVGANVTVPHKGAVGSLCDRLTEEAALIGAVNTLAWTSDGLLGDNTDAAGLHDVFAGDLGLRAGTKVCVLGTGGAARAVVVAAGRIGAEVVVVGRRPDAIDDLEELAQRAGATSTDGIELGEEQSVRAAVSAAELVCNATPLGMEREELPSPFMSLHTGQIAYDLVYSPPETPFLQAALAAGADTHHGLGMLIGQAAASYRRWTGRDAPVATMSAAALGALAGPDRAES